MDPVAEGAHQVGLAAARFAQQQQDPARGEPRRLEHAVDRAIEPVPGVRVDRLDVERVGLPDVVAVGERVEEVRKLAEQNAVDSRVAGAALGLAGAA